MQKAIFIFGCACMLVIDIYGQPKNTWKGKKAAVVITYDDAIDQHLDNAAPVLDSLGLKATFYVTGFSASMRARLKEWKQLAVKGHELGNHTLYHPCTGGPGREWVKPDYDLNNYTIPRLLDEISATNLLLQSMDGKTKRTFAFTCGDTRVKDSSFVSLIKQDFTALRGVRGQMHTIGQVDLQDVDCYVVNHHTADQMIAWVNEAVKNNSLLVVLFHGVGGGNGLDVEVAEHRKFLRYLKEKQNELWIAPMVDVADHIKEWQKKYKPQQANRKPMAIDSLSTPAFADVYPATNTATGLDKPESYRAGIPVLTVGIGNSSMQPGSSSGERRFLFCSNIPLFPLHTAGKNYSENNSSLDKMN
ncbi:MAG: polysaccharide deacetylase family protein [Bacteroidetes bacterium]|nr:polysaccharide deacetylase family protein [Bacteroidota bacterium]